MNKPSTPRTFITEPLESRQMLHASGEPFVSLTSRGTLILISVATDNTFVVFPNGNNVQVLHDGVTQDFPAASVARIFFAGQAGADFVQINVPIRSELHGGDGNDTLLGGSRQDLIFGGTGADFLSGGSQNDTIDGGGGKDRIYGKGGDDSLIGGSGNDRIHGGLGNDFINGGRDNDTLTGADGNDSFFGGTGADTVVDFNSASDIVDGVETL
ncbi:MAG TPA: calcium-binding protein [Tepidisphaeraceae bacterium]|nr:calcium-binding protein [Tepidisphaeraceae bacterium]